MKTKLILLLTLLPIVCSAQIWESGTNLVNRGSITNSGNIQTATLNVTGATTLGTAKINSPGSAATVVNLGLDASGNVVTNASPVGGGGGGGVSNSIPLTVFAADGTNIWLNATQANSFFFYATNNFIVNITNVAGQCAMGETRRLIVQQGGNFTASLTNTLRMSFGREITGFNISTTTNSVNWVAFGHFATSNRWDTLGNVTTYGP